MSNKKEQIFRILPERLKRMVDQVMMQEDLDFEQVTEICIRVGKPVCVYLGGKEVRVNYTAGREELKEIVNYMSRYSPYAFEEEMRKGFLTIEGGHRVGMAGKAITEQDRVRNLRYVSSVHIRAAHEVKGCANKVFPYIANQKELCHTMIISPPGCGKTTLLRLTGGLETADSGEIRWASAHKTAFVFQEPRLMPWLTVWENVVFGLSKKETDPGKIEAVIRMVGLSGFEKAYPAQLSGGMQQRAAIARALAYEPTFIMMDEPFAALDYFTREQMQKELLRVQQERSASILFVTHSIDEALILGSQIAVIEKGMVKALYEVKAPQEERNLLEDEMITLKRDIINNLHFI